MKAYKMEKNALFHWRQSTVAAQVFANMHGFPPSFGREAFAIFSRINADIENPHQGLERLEKDTKQSNPRAFRPSKEKCFLSSVSV